MVKYWSCRALIGAKLGPTLLVATEDGGGDNAERGGRAPPGPGSAQRADPDAARPRGSGYDQRDDRIWAGDCLV